MYRTVASPVGEQADVRPQTRAESGKPGLGCFSGRPGPVLGVSSPVDDRVCYSVEVKDSGQVVELVLGNTSGPTPVLA